MIQISNAVLTAVIDHAVSLAPIESCGYLSAVGDTIARFIPMTNVDDSPEHFSFDPKEQFQAIKSARAAGESLRVVYHSHPETPARLSAEDIRLFNDPSMIYLIVSLKDTTPTYAAFQIQKPEPGRVIITPVSILIHE
jgi:proteasome lid subunit RPN8/RPN11